MKVIFGMLMMLLCLFGIVLLRSITTFLHEMGHAIPALLFSKEKVDLYVGSYGEADKSGGISIGRLTLHLKFNPFLFNMGMVSHGEIKDTWKHILVVLGGPFCSILLILPLFYLAMTHQLNEFLIIALGILSISSFIDLAVNLFPSSWKTSNSQLLSDGMILQILLTRVFSSKEVQRMDILYQEERYEELIQEANELLEEKPNELIHRMLIDAYEKTHDQHELLIAYDEFTKYHKLDYSDYFRLGKIYMSLSNEDEAIRYFNICYELNFNDGELLEYIGEIRLHDGDYKTALQRLTGAIEFENDSPRVRCLRGQCYTKLKMYERAIGDFQKAINGNPEDAESFYNLGVLYERTGHYEASLLALSKALELEPEKPGLAFKIELIKEHVPAE